MNRSLRFRISVMKFGKYNFSLQDLEQNVTNILQNVKRDHK